MSVSPAVDHQFACEEEPDAVDVVVVRMSDCVVCAAVGSMVGIVGVDVQEWVVRRYIERVHRAILIAVVQALDEMM